MFDLDGTLLAIGFEDFVTSCMNIMEQKMAGLGYNAKQYVNEVWNGIHAMLKNNGSQTNEQAFWNGFSFQKFGSRQQIEQHMNDFYENDFKGIRSVVREERNLRTMVDGLKAKGYTLSLATNPIFPQNGVEQRLAWLGLTLSDFKVVTSYENSRYCKPALGYFEEVLKEAGFSAKESIMVGNDINDDMPAMELGIQTYLVTDVLENKKEGFEEQYLHGTFSQLQTFFEKLPNIKG